MPSCKRCGQCCQYINDDGKLTDCRYLVRTGKLTSCRKYSNRIGTKIYHNATCQDRVKILKLFPGCTYNEQVINMMKKEDIQKWYDSIEITDKRLKWIKETLGKVLQAEDEGNKDDN